MWAKLKELVTAPFALLASAFSASPGKRPTGLARAVGWVLLALLILAVTVGLWYLKLEPPPLGMPEWLQKVYWPVLFLLFCATLLLAYWIYRLWFRPEPAVYYEDIHEAWSEARQALDEAGIDFTTVPVYLVLGRPVGPIGAQTEDGLFAASDLRLLVPGVPNRPPPSPAASVRVFASKHAVFVTCAGASALGGYAAVLARKDRPTLKKPGQEDRVWEQMSMRLQQTLRPGPEALAAIRAAQTAGAGAGPLVDQSLYPGGQAHTLGGGNSFMTGSSGRSNPAVARKSPDFDPEEQKDRLGYLCSLIAAERLPDKPLQGTLLLLPMAGSDSDALAEQTAAACRQDLEVIQDSLGVHCPRIALVCDLQTITGFHEFARRFSSSEREGRLGRSFPIVPAVPPDQLRAEPARRLMDDYTQYIFGKVFPNFVYGFFELEGPPSPRRPRPKGMPDELTLAEAVKENKNLFYFVCQMVERRGRISQILHEGLFAPSVAPPLFGGCYIAGTGTDPVEQAFVVGVFQRFVPQDKTMQDAVTWTDEAVADDTSYRRKTRWGYCVVTVLAALMAVVCIVLGDRLISNQ